MALLVIGNFRILKLLTGLHCKRVNGEKRAQKKNLAFGIQKIHLARLYLFVGRVYVRTCCI